MIQEYIKFRMLPPPGPAAPGIARRAGAHRVLQAQFIVITDSQVAMLLRRQLECSPELDLMLQLYNLTCQANPEHRSYALLISQVRAHLQEKRRRRNKESLYEHFRGSQQVCRSKN